MTLWQIGETIGNRREVLRILKGGMGHVYVALDRSSVAPVALKTISQDHAPSRLAVHRFEQEARVWLGLGPHENVVELYLIHRIDGAMLLELEYVGGGDLGEWIRQQRRSADI